METIKIIKIIKTGYEVVSGKSFAYCENCQFEISNEDRIDWGFRILQGEELFISKAWFDGFGGEKYEY